MIQGSLDNLFFVSLEANVIYNCIKACSNLGLIKSRESVLKDADSIVVELFVLLHVLILLAILVNFELSDLFVKVCDFVLHSGLF